MMPMVMAVMRVAMAMGLPEEDSPNESQQCNQGYGAQDNEPFPGGRINAPDGQDLARVRPNLGKKDRAHTQETFFSKVAVSSSASIPTAIFNRCIR
jgi:hypothetical protein